MVLYQYCLSQDPKHAIEKWSAFAGAVILPAGKGFPGTRTGDSEATTDKKAVFFATAGEKGVVKIWSAATAQCVYEQQGLGSIQAGNYVELGLMAGGAGLMAASADCNLHFFAPQVMTLWILAWCCAVFLLHMSKRNLTVARGARFMAASADCNLHFFAPQVW